MNNNSGNGGPGNGNNGSFNNIRPDIFGGDQNAAPLTLDEEASMRSIIAEDDMDRAYDDHIEATHRKMWFHFQAAAASLTHLYREREHLNLRNNGRRNSGAGGGGAARNTPTSGNSGVGGRGGGGASDVYSEDNSLWAPFQNAAGNLTTLYRESWDGLLRPSVQIAKKSGYQRARKELASWARSRRRCIRREELLAVLASMNSQHASSPHGLDSTLQRSHQPLLGVEELLQAASVNETSAAAAGNHQSAASANAALAASNIVSPEQVVLRSLKRPLPSPPVSANSGGGGNAHQVRTTPPPVHAHQQQQHSSLSDVNMSEHYSPVFKKPRH